MRYRLTLAPSRESMDVKDLTLRNATPADMDRLLALEQEVVAAERPFNPSIKDSDARYYDLPKLLSDPDTQLLVGEMDGQIVATGYAQVRDSEPAFRHDRHAYLGFMCVVPECRGRRINERIMQALIDWGRGRGIRDFYLDVYVDNGAAIRAYEKCGFTRSMVEMKLEL